MKVCLVAIFLVGLFTACAAEDDPTVSLPGVTDLTPENFDGLVNGRRHALVEFYAPWCGHCKRMTPEFKKLGEHVQGDAKLNSRVLVAKVDADKHSSLGSRFEVKGFPTILYFARGKPVESFTPYQGGRTYDAFLKFLQDQLEADTGFARSPALDKLAATFLAASAEDKSAVVAQAEEATKELAEDLRDAGSLYGKYMTKAIAKGSEYLEKEYERLDRIIGSGAVGPAKMAEVSRKASVLTAFIPRLNEPATQAAPDAEEEAEEEAEGAEVYEE